jgi:hypothetical protein
MRVTEQQAKHYFETLVKFQSDDAVNMLLELFSRQVAVEDFINSVCEDIIDIEYVEVDE